MQQHTTHWPFSCRSSSQDSDDATVFNYGSLHMCIPVWRSAQQWMHDDAFLLHCHASIAVVLKWGRQNNRRQQGSNSAFVSLLCTVLKDEAAACEFSPCCPVWSSTYGDGITDMPCNHASQALNCKIMQRSDIKIEKLATCESTETSGTCGTSCSCMSGAWKTKVRNAGRTVDRGAEGRVGRANRGRGGHVCCLQWGPVYCPKPHCLLRAL